MYDNKHTQEPMMTLLRSFWARLRRNDQISPPVSRSGFFAGRAHALSDVLVTLSESHVQDFDALASELGIAADVDFARLALEAARISAVRVDFTTIAPCIEFLRAAAAGRALGAACSGGLIRMRNPDHGLGWHDDGESRPDIHSFDWTSLESTGPSYRAASRALADWFIYYNGNLLLMGDLSDGETICGLKAAETGTLSVKGNA